MRGIGFSAAFRTLTRFPFPGKDPHSVSTSLYWFPLVGFLYGCCDYLLFLLPFPRTVDAALLIAWNAWMSRGFHLDGLCDMFDGFGGGFTKERRLAIMKDSHIGSFGLIALFVTLLCQYALYGELGKNVSVLFAAPVLGRTMQVALAVFLPYARTEGTAGALVRGAKIRHLVVSSLFAALLLVPFGEPVLWAMVAFAVLAAFVVGMMSRRLIGGVTGDVLGAAEVLSETVSLFGALAFLVGYGNTF